MKSSPNPFARSFMNEGVSNLKYFLSLTFSADTEMIRSVGVRGESENFNYKTKTNNFHRIRNNFSA